jgi:hypothetical protein
VHEVQYRSAIDLEAALGLSHMTYCNDARTHLSLDKDAPIPAVQAVGRILPTPILGGLHHHNVPI